jgi:hypothetical protein
MKQTETQTGIQTIDWKHFLYISDDNKGKVKISVCLSTMHWKCKEDNEIILH